MVGVVGTPPIGCGGQGGAAGQRARSGGATADGRRGCELSRHRGHGVHQLNAGPSPAPPRPVRAAELDEARGCVAPVPPTLSLSAFFFFLWWWWTIFTGGCVVVVVGWVVVVVGGFGFFTGFGNLASAFSRFAI